MATAPLSLFNIFSDVREFLIAGFRSFPTAFAGTALFIGLFTANYAMLFFLMGLLLWTPAINFILNPVLQWILFFLPSSITQAGQGPVCNLVLKDAQVGEGVGPTAAQQIVSDWAAMAIFAFSYIFTNAYALYTLPTIYPPNATADDQAATDEKAGLRKSRAVLSMIMILAVALVFLAIRVFVSRCDTVFGMVLGLLVFGHLGVGWYFALRGVGQDRLSDLFGVANRILSPSALANQPYVCLPQTSTQ